MKDVYTDIGIAKLDLSRAQRTGMPETIYTAGKTKEQLLKILQTFYEKNISVLATRCSPEKYDFVKNNGLPLSYDETSQVLTLKGTQKTPKYNGKIAVLTGGTADLKVAEEAALTAEFFGAEVERFYDVGITGLHRLISKMENIKKADVIIAVAGMEGALASVVAGQVKAPVIAVPTSVGYGASFEGLAPLLTMINSCAEGISVVNIDNGFGAAVQACRILRLRGLKNE